VADLPDRHFFLTAKAETNLCLASISLAVRIFLYEALQHEISEMNIHFIHNFLINDNTVH
jgi:hypothetical protein